MIPTLTLTTISRISQVLIRTSASAGQETRQVSTFAEAFVALDWPRIGFNKSFALSAVLLYNSSSPRWWALESQVGFLVNSRIIKLGEHGYRIV